MMEWDGGKVAFHCNDIFLQWHIILSVSARDRLRLRTAGSARTTMVGAVSCAELLLVGSEALGPKKLVISVCFWTGAAEKKLVISG